MLTVILTVVIVVFLTRHYLQCTESLAALCAECEASKAFIEWRFRNPGVYAGLSVEGRMLIDRWLEAHDWFQRTHTFIDGREYRERILSLLNDLPPKSPNSLPIGTKSVVTDALSFCV